MKNQKPKLPRDRWESPISNYTNLNTDSCKLIFEQSKDYFEETVAETEELTERSSKMLFLFIPGVFAVIAYVATNYQKFKQINSFRLLLLISCVITASNVVGRLLQLMGTKNIHYRGSKPESIMRKEIMEIPDSSDLLKALYISEIEYFQVKIEQNEFWNWNRIKLYKEVIGSFILFVCIGILLFIMSISLT